MTRMMAKAKRKQFVKVIRDYLLSIGAVETKADLNNKHSIYGDFPSYEFVYDSKCGTLHLAVHARGSYKGSSGPGDVMSRFALPKMAHRHVNCNPHSGKWNHQYFENCTIEEALENFKSEMEKITPTTLEDFVQKTSLVPNIIAGIVVENRNTKMDDPLYVVQNRLCHDEAREWFIKYVERQAVFLWDNNKTFRKSCSYIGNSGLDTLYAFVEYWLDNYLDDPVEYRKKFTDRFFCTL